MMQVRKAAQRGSAGFDWLDTRYSFSFADYFDPAHMGFRSLRVMNEDRVAPGRGFPMHGHRDMEILTYVLAGRLEHRDSLGNGSVIPAGALQRMTAGTGILHSEYNPSDTEPVHLYQIWIRPEREGLQPGYQELAAAANPASGLRLVAARDGRQGSLTIHQDADVYLAALSGDETITQPLRSGRHAWLQVLRGSVAVHGTHLGAGDGVAISQEPSLEIVGDGPAEVMLFDLS